MRSATQPYCNTVEYGCVSLRMRLFSENFGTIKRILPGSSSPSHREGPGIEVDKSKLKNNAGSEFSRVTFHTLFYTNSFACSR